MGPDRKRPADSQSVATPIEAPIPAVRIDHLTKTLRNGVTAVDDLSLAVGVGQVLALVGPNGSGKTITFKILLGLVRPTAGQVAVFGEPIRPGAPVLARVGALVDGPGFVPHLSGRTNLALACREMELFGGTPDLEGAIVMTGLGDAIDRPFADYSHGMRYRLAIAQALLGGPELLLLDEPTTGLDPAQMIEVQRAIASCVAAGATVILSSHHFAEVERICTHAAVLRNGRLIAAGTVAALVGRFPRIHLELDRPGEAVTLLVGTTGVTAVEALDSGVLVEGVGLRAADLVADLHAGGVTVTAFRSATFEDSYLALLRDGDEGPTATGEAGRADGPDRFIP